MLYTINSSQMFVTKSVLKFIFVLSNYQTCTSPLTKYNLCKYAIYLCTGTGPRLILQRLNEEAQSLSNQKCTTGGKRYQLVRLVRKQQQQNTKIKPLFRNACKSNTRTGTRGGSRPSGLSTATQRFKVSYSLKHSERTFFELKETVEIERTVKHHLV